MTTTLFNGDCLEVMPEIESGSVDMILTDPPYNVNKAKWDSWPTVDAYVDFMGKFFKESERVLKDNGSFYFFHNDFAQMAELQYWISRNTKFVHKAIINWIKPNFRPLSWKNPSEKSNLRTWFNCVEYCLFYTFQDETGLSKIEKEYIAPRNPFAKELRSARLKKGVSINQVAEYGHFYGNVNHGGAVTNWERGYNIPSKEQWLILCKNLPIIRQEYEGLRQEYEGLRYTHNLDENHNNIWQSNEKNSGKDHPTQKPIDITERIIKASSNEGDTIFDPFMGSGTTGVACKNLNRNFIGIEKDEEYFKLAKDRIEKS